MGPRAEAGPVAERTGGTVVGCSLPGAESKWLGPRAESEEGPGEGHGGTCARDWGSGGLAVCWLRLAVAWCFTSRE